MLINMDAELSATMLVPGTHWNIDNTRVWNELKPLICEGIGWSISKVFLKMMDRRSCLMASQNKQRVKLLKRSSRPRLKNRCRMRAGKAHERISVGRTTWNCTRMHTATSSMRGSLLPRLRRSIIFSRISLTPDWTMERIPVLLMMPRWKVSNFAKVSLVHCSHTP
jgi:hypothetical protein